ncbi:MAG TPA: S1 RNA-binding domain-containing protein [Aggregatilineaceae bacterium]|jgi:ribosomal protein S1|nr:S1 RNA-binding domain-containing protein [Aggregatilineaceae bacterium]
MTTEKPAPSTIDEITAKMELQGVVKKIDLYGALVDIGIGRLGLLHISQLSENHVKNVSDIVHEGDQITVWVQDLDRKKGRINLTMIRPAAVGWNEIAEGNVYSGTVVRLEKFGVFVDIGAERPGLVHVSELAAGYVSDPSEVVSMGDTIEVKVIKVNRRKKQVDLSVRALGQPATSRVQEVEQDLEPMPTAMELALRQALEGSGIDLPAKNQGKRRTKKNRQRREEREAIFARTLQEHSKE